jgi:hypothetical protein
MISLVSTPARVLAGVVKKNIYIFLMIITILLKDDNTNRSI